MMKPVFAVFVFLLLASASLGQVAITKQDVMNASLAALQQYFKTATVATTPKIFMMLHGTEYAAGEPATIWLQLLKDSVPVNNATCEFVVYNPGKSVFMDVIAEHLAGSDGIYYKDFTAPSTAGVYMVSGKCSTPANAFSDDFLDYSKLESYQNITVTNGKVLLSNFPLELPDYKGVEPTANMTGNVLLYHMNEATGMIVDYSGEGNNGTDYEASYGVAGKINTALWFNGVNSGVGVVESNSWKPANSVTVEAWVKFDEIADKLGTIAGGSTAGNGYFLAVNPYANLVYFYLNGVYNYYVVYGQGFSANTWYHIAGTYDRYGGANNQKIYVNGQVIAQRTSSGAIGNYNGLGIGSSSTYKFKGTIDEVAIFNRSLSVSEVLNHYSRGAGFPTNSGYIRSNPIDLAGINWHSFSSDYVLNDGSINFKILDSSNSVLCSSLGNISLCANTTSPIKLYAQLAMPTNTSISPDIYNWLVTWNLSSFEEIRGSGEMHVSAGKISEEISEGLSSAVSDIIRSNMKFHGMEFSGTDYWPGERATVFLQLRDASGAVVNNASCNFDLYNSTNPLMPPIYSKQPMIFRGADGIYYYQFSTMGFPEGVYPLDAECAYVYDNIYYYPAGSLQAPSITINTGSFQGGTPFVLNSGLDSLYYSVKHAGNVVNITAQFNVSTGTTAMTFIWLGDTDSARTLRVYAKNWTSGAGVVLGTMTTTGFGIGHDDLFAANFPLNLSQFINFTGSVSVDIVTTGGAHTTDHNWITLKTFQNSTYVTEIKGSSEIHIYSLNITNAILHSNSILQEMGAVLNSVLNLSAEINLTSHQTLVLLQGVSANVTAGTSAILDLLSSMNLTAQQILSLAQATNLTAQETIVLVQNLNLTAQQILSLENEINSTMMRFVVVNVTNTTFVANVSVNVTSVNVVINVTNATLINTTLSGPTIDEVSQKVWNRFWTLGTPPLLPSTTYACLNSTILLKNITFNVCTDVGCTEFTKVEQQPCTFGCDVARNVCIEPPMNRAAIIIGIIIVVLALLWLARRFYG
jgi:hypothetical protein